MAMPAKLRADLFFERSLKLVAGVSVVSLTAIVVFLCAQAFPAFKEMSLTDFLFSTHRYPTDDEPSFGIGALIVGSLACALLTTLIAVPLGVLTAACMHCGMHEKIRRFVKPLIELMAALPSVVIGFIGMVVLAPWLQQTFNIASGLNLTNAALMLAFMCIPTIASISEDALKNVPNALREASLALGASKFQTLYKVVLPQALPGILTATVLSIGRIVGESAALIFTLGGSVNTLPAGLVGRGSQSSTLTVWVYSLLSEMRPGNEELAYAVSVILLVLVAIIYVGLGLIESFSKKEKGTKKRKDKIKPPEVTA